MDSSVHHRQSTGYKLGRHTQKSRDNHPENSTGTTGTHSNCYTRDIPLAYSGRQRTGQCLKMRNFTGIIRIVIPSANHISRMFYSAQRDPAKIKRVINATTYEHNYDEWNI